MSIIHTGLAFACKGQSSIHLLTDTQGSPTEWAKIMTRMCYFKCEAHFMHLLHFILKQATSFLLILYTLTRDLCRRLKLIIKERASIEGHLILLYLLYFLNISQLQRKQEFQIRRCLDSQARQLLIQ